MSRPRAARCRHVAGRAAGDSTRARAEPVPILVAIVGGSGAGKTWLARRLQTAIARGTTRLALDDFYRDRSGLPPHRRERINFDHPRAIDWQELERVLRDCAAGRSAQVPGYDFKTHCRRRRKARLAPGRCVIVDGLWLLRRPAIRRLFALRIFIECPARTRLRRRLARDLVTRGRTRASVFRQFAGSVQPMHERFVAPQKRWADVVLRHPFGMGAVRQLRDRLRALAGSA